MKKQSGFTLIELMVVMAIIAILATAGLAAYTGYIKKARDTTRIADIAAINTVVLGLLTTSGNAPTTATTVTASVTAANNGVALADPLGITAACITSSTVDTLMACGYRYKVCDAGSGYAIGAKFESKSNQAMYTNADLGGVDDLGYYEVGSCKVACHASTANTPTGCPNPALGSYTAI